MKIEEQVLSVEQILHLREFGVEVKDTALCIIPRESGHKCYVPTEVVFPQDEDVKIPTLTLQEILEMLPEEIDTEYGRAFLILNKEDDIISYIAEDYDGSLTIDYNARDGEGMLTNAYNMLCWCAKNGYLNNKENENN